MLVGIASIFIHCFTCIDESAGVDFSRTSLKVFNGGLGLKWTAGMRIRPFQLWLWDHELAIDQLRWRYMKKQIWIMLCIQFKYEMLCVDECREGEMKLTV